MEPCGTPPMRQQQPTQSWWEAASFKCKNLPSYLLASTATASILDNLMQREQSWLQLKLMLRLVCQQATFAGTVFHSCLCLSQFIVVLLHRNYTCGTSCF